MITSILTQPGLGTTTRLTPKAYRPDGQAHDRLFDQVDEMILVGVVLDGNRVTWGLCATAPEESLPEYPSPFRATEGMATIQEVVAPNLIGQPLDSFSRLATVVEDLVETVTIERILPQPEPEEQPTGYSRRDIISGFLSYEASPAETAPAVEQVTVERRIHPAIRHGLSQALLAAVAIDRHKTMAEVLVEEYQFPYPQKPVPLHLTIRRGQSIRLYPQVASLGHVSTGADPATELGVEGERLQGFVRQLRERIASAAGEDEQPAIYLDLRGGLGQLFEDDTGKILGALYGLEQAASPGGILVQDPLILGDLDAQIDAMGQLRDYIRMRRMSLQLVTRARINSLDDVRAFVQAKAAHWLHLEMPRLGTVQEVVLAIKACRDQDIGVLLVGTPAAIAAQVALATSPDLLACPQDWPAEAGIVALHDEMARTIAWLAHQAS